jgi:response regulator RpfG family c-di-GMP phosphodiesterase
MSDRITFLYVDDEPINLMLMETLFRKKFNIITARSAADAFAVLESNRQLQVVISDMRMTKMNGLDFIRSAKKNYPYIKFYILTGYEVTQEIEDALSDGTINSYFKKPFQMKEIEEVLINTPLD